MAEALVRSGQGCIIYQALSSNPCKPQLQKTNAFPLSTSNNTSQARIRRAAVNGKLREKSNLCRSAIRGHLEQKSSERVKRNDDRRKQVAGTLLTGALAVALTLLPATDVEAHAASSAVNLPLAAAVKETPSAEYAADLFAQLKGYTSSAAEQFASTTSAAPEKVSKEDPVTAAIESIKVGEQFDVPKLPEVAGPSFSALKERSTVSEQAPRVAEAAGTAGGGLIDRLKKSTEEGQSKLGGSIAASKQLFGRLKEGVTDKIGGQKSAPEAVQEVVEAPKPGGFTGWLSEWTGGKETEKKADQGFEKKREQSPGNFFSRGTQAVQSAAKQSAEFFQPKPPPKEETGLAGVWQSLTRLDFLPENLKGGAITVKKALSVILTVLGLVLSIFSKALGLAADLIGIIARGL